MIPEPYAGKLGVFFVGRDIYESFPDLVRHVQSLGIIINLDFKVERMAFEFIMFSDLFERLEANIRAPHYVLSFDRPLQREPQIMAEQDELGGLSFCQDPMQFPERFRVEWTKIKEHEESAERGRRRLAELAARGDESFQPNTPHNPRLASREDIDAVVDEILTKVPGAVPETKSSAPESKAVAFDDDHTQE